MRMGNAIFAVLLLVATHAAAGALEEMAGFERVFIPALALTNQPQAPAGRVQASVARLNAGMAGFERSFAAHGAELERAIREARAAALEAERLLAEGRRAEAHDALERIRAVMMGARGKLDLELYVDRLTEFHDVMEDFVKRATGGATPTELRGLLAQASGLWRNAERLRFEPQLFGMDATGYEKLRAMVNAEREVLTALEEAVETGERARIGELARTLKSNFARIYTSFGDFRGL